MLEWLDVRLDVGCDKRLMYEYRIEPLKCDRDALKQECRLARIADPPIINININIDRNDYSGIYSSIRWSLIGEKLSIGLPSTTLTFELMTLNISSVSRGHGIE